MNRKNLFAMLLCFGIILICSSRVLPAQLSTLRVVPPYLEIGTFFSGREVKLSGSVLSNQDIIFEIRGPEEKSMFNMKGRIGPFWVNREKIQLQHAPSLYKLLLPGGRKWSSLLYSLGVGIEKLKHGLIIRPDNISPDMVFERFFQLKRSEHLYGEVEGAIHYSRPREGKKHFETECYFPSSTAPGKYRIVAMLVDNGKIEETSVQSFVVEEIGLIRGVHELAYHRGLIYGILCVVIALLVGAIIGLFFKRIGAH